MNCSSPMALAEHCNGFLLPCLLMLEMQQQGFSMDTAKIIIISLLSGRALQWANTIWEQANSVTQFLNKFLSHFREVFGHLARDSSINVTAQSPLRQAVYYYLCTPVLNSSFGWDESALLTTYCQRQHISI